MRKVFDDDSETCVTLGVEKICDNCLDYYISNLYGICVACHYYKLIKNTGIKSIVPYLKWGHEENLYYIKQIITKHFPEHKEWLEKLLILK